MKYVLVAGYKPNELGIFNDKHPGIPYLKEAIKRKILQLLDEGLEWVIVNGLPGVSYWTADVVMQLKEEYPNLKLAIVEAYTQQLEGEKEMAYLNLLQKADHSEIVMNAPYSGPNQLRHHNKLVLAKSDAMIILYDEDQEGSPKYILEMAEKRAMKDDYPIYKINQSDLQDIVEEEQNQMRES